jgi:hypothetical protein
LRTRNRALNSNWDEPPYNAYTKAIHGLACSERSRLRLDPDQSFYWRFLFDELGVVANGELRLRKVLACGHHVTFFGGFADPESRKAVEDAGCTLAAKYIPYGEMLGAAYRGTADSIDVANAPYLNGFSTKLFSCFASGGFMLTTRQRDLPAVLG